MNRSLIAAPFAAALAVSTLAAPASAATIAAKAASIDSCRYQVPYDYYAGAARVFAVTGDGVAHQLAIRERDQVRMSVKPLEWRTVVQVDACADGVTGRVSAIRVVTDRGSSGDLVPAGRLPNRPEIKAVDRVDAIHVTVRWTAATGTFDRYALQEDIPFYQSELGAWQRYAYQVDVPANTTSTTRRLETSTAPKDRTHTYWVRTVKNGFVSDLRDEKKISVQP